MSVIESHGLQQPKVGELFDSLTMVLPRDEVDTVWRNACLELELSIERTGELDLRLLRELAERLTRQRGLVSIIARSFAIRIDSFSALEGGRHA